MVVTPTLTYASGTWTLTQKHEKMIKTAQRNMLRLEKKIQDKKKATSTKDEEPEMLKNEDNENTSGTDTGDDSQQASNKGQDSDVSFQAETDEELDATENEEDWSNSSKEVRKKLKNIWKKTRYHAGLKYTGEQDGEWHAESFLYLKKDGTKEFSNGILSIRTGRQVGRPQRRWNDDLNEFTKSEEGQDKAKYDLLNNNSWINEIKVYKK